MTAHVLIRAGSIIRATGSDDDVPWWSFTKTVLAAAALVLVRDGLLTLDETMPGRRHTLRQLLQHRAGLADYGSLSSYHAAVARDDDAWTSDEMLDRADAGRLLFEPGAGWAYSNIGYFHVRELIEQTTGAAMGEALEKLVLGPLGITDVRLASARADFELGYDPGWVYHGLLVGPLVQAALLLQRFLTGDLLPRDLSSAMLDRYSVGGPIPGRPWKTPAYGLGLMIGDTTGGTLIAGHTGSGPGSRIAVYHALEAPRALTAAAFSSVARDGLDDGVVEHACVGLLEP